MTATNMVEISDASALHSPSQRWRHVLFLLVLLLLLWPLLSATFPPFLDYYSHLARVHITSNIDAFSAFYSANEIYPPNLAFDLIVRSLLGAVSLEQAGWVFLVSLIVLQASGLWALNRLLTNRQSLPIGPIVGCAILYNSVLTMGFLSYLFGLGLMLWTVWLWLRVRERNWWIVLSVACAANVVLYFAHLIAFGVYALVIFGYELHLLIADRRRPLPERTRLFLRSGIPFLLPVLLYLTSFQGDMKVVMYPQKFLYGKLLAIVGTLNTGATPLRLSLAGFAILAILLVALARIKLSPPMVLPIALLTLIFFAAPTAFGAGSHFDDRLPLAIGLVVCASIGVEVPDRRRAVILLAALMAFIAIRSLDLSRDFSRFDREVQRALRLFATIEPGSVVVVAIDTTHPDFTWSARGRSNWHVASLAALHAPVFVATTHARASQHTMFLNGALFTNLYTWQKELPIELATREQLADTVAQYREIAGRGRVSIHLPNPRLYLLVLMPEDLSNATESFGRVIGTTDWFLLLEIEQEARTQPPGAWKSSHQYGARNPWQTDYFLITASS